MRMDRMIEMLLSLGVLVGGGYLFAVYVWPKINSSLSPQIKQEKDSACSGGSCSEDKYNAALEDDSDEGVLSTVSEAIKDGLSYAGIGGLLTNANKVVTATSLDLGQSQKTTVPTRTNQPYGSLVNVAGPAGATLPTTWIR